MTKYLTTTAITHVGGTTTFTDTATYGGGSAAASMVKMCKDVIVKDANGATTIIPWHAINKVVITYTSTTVDDPTDTFCGTEESSDSGSNDSGSDDNGGGENSGT